VIANFLKSLILHLLEKWREALDPQLKAAVVKYNAALALYRQQIAAQDAGRAQWLKEVAAGEVRLHDLTIERDRLTTEVEAIENDLSELETRRVEVNDEYEKRKAELGQKQIELNKKQAVLNSRTVDDDLHASV
jgi:chromosome segregation ATPase